MKKFGVIVGIFLAVCLFGNNRLAATSCHGGGGGGSMPSHSGAGKGNHSGHDNSGYSGEKSETTIEIKESFYSKIYICPMHPEVKSDKSGKCPECGMKLKKKQVLMTYACPEKDCEFHRATTDICPKHNMELVKTEMKYHCPKCGEQVNPKDLKLKPVK